MLFLQVILFPKPRGYFCNGALRSQGSPLSPTPILLPAGEGRGGTVYTKDRKSRLALVPPKPKELHMAVRIWTWRAVFGT